MGAATGTGEGPATGAVTGPATGVGERPDPRLTGAAGLAAGAGA